MEIQGKIFLKDQTFNPTVMKTDNIKEYHM